MAEAKQSQPAKPASFKKQKRLPIGTDDFERVRQENLYYVDKTSLIEQMFDNWAQVTLFTRPRRFGKSLNMSMLKHFFEIGSDPSLFDGLAIMQHEGLCEQHMGKYPVIFLSLKKVDGEDFKTAYAGLLSEIQREVKRLSYLQTSNALDSGEKELIKQFKTKSASKDDIRDAIYTLSYFLEKHHGQKTIILIDEYDVPLDKAYINGYYDKMIDLIRAMFGSALKTNSSLQLAVLTGCLRVSKESVFTGLNNFRVCGISDLEYTECFGFTEGEVREMFEYYGVENRMQDAKAWYDGYHFGNQEIYCPWDVINFCQTLRSCPTAQPTAYWTNTSGNDVVRNLIKKSDSDVVKGDIESLINGGTIQKELNVNITYREIEDSINNLWSLLYMTGYLTTTKPPSGDMFELRIPNYEITTIYKKQVLGWFSERLNAEAKENRKQLEALFEAFVTGNAAEIKRLLEERLLTTVSYFDAHENFYHGFLLALLSTCNNWYLTSNRESGSGRCDIVLERSDGSVGIVIELKYTKDPDDLPKACTQAIEQINKKNYAAAFRRKHLKQIYKMGIAFSGKECEVLVE